MSTRSFLLGAIGVALLAVLVGAYFVGSPHEARRRTFDNRRYVELEVLAGALQCASDKTVVLPVELTVQSLRSYCGARNIQPPMFTDDETGEPYAYVRKSDEQYSICAKFYDASRTAHLRYSNPNSRWSFDTAAGCLTGTIR
jgi:hypothetical protein